MREELLTKYRMYLEVHRKAWSSKNQRDVKQAEYEKALKEAEEIPDSLGNCAFWIIALKIVSVILLVANALYSGRIEMAFGCSESDVVGFILSLFVCEITGLNLLGRYCDIKYDRVAKREKLEEYKTEILPGLERELSIANCRYEESIGQPDYLAYMQDVPGDYQTLEAMEFFIKMLETRRAETEKELFNLYESEKHREQMKRLEEEKLEKYEASLIRCPNCGGTRCMVMTESRTRGHYFSLFRGCCGSMLFGPFGWLCGLCGAWSETTSDAFLMCPDCGNKFKR